jgi:hypothetical protein
MIKARPISVNRKPMIKEVLPNRSNIRILKGTNIGNTKNAGYEVNNLHSNLQK